MTLLWSLPLCTTPNSPRASSSLIVMLSDAFSNFFMSLISWNRSFHIKMLVVAEILPFFFKYLCPQKCLCITYWILGGYQQWYVYQGLKFLSKNESFHYLAFGFGLFQNISIFAYFFFLPEGRLGMSAKIAFQQFPISLILFKKVAAF